MESSIPRRLDRMNAAEMATRDDRPGTGRDNHAPAAQAHTGAGAGLQPSIDRDIAGLLPPQPISLQSSGRFNLGHDTRPGARAFDRGQRIRSAAPLPTQAAR